MTDNLVAVWDCSSGLDANGWTTCYSADGQNHTFVWTGEEKDTITFDSTNGVRFTGSASAYGALPSADCTTTFKAAENGTMEIVFLREETQYGSCVLQVPNNDGRQGLLFYKDFYNNRFFTCNPDGNQRPTYVFSENDCLVRSLAVHSTDGLASENSVTLNGESVPKYGADSL